MLFRAALTVARALAMAPALVMASCLCTTALAATTPPDPASSRAVILDAQDNSVLVVDGAPPRVSGRIALAHPARGQPLMSADGRVAYVAASDGWVSRLDLQDARISAEIRAGIRIAGIALSGDGRWLLVGNSEPHTLLLLDAQDLSRKREYPARTEDGLSSGVSAVRTAAPRQSFVVTFSDMPRLWELSYDPHAEPLFRGLVHDFRMGEGIAEPGQFAVRVTNLPAAFTGFLLDATAEHAIGATPDGQTLVINLDARRRIADIPLPGVPVPGQGVSFVRDGRPALAIPARDTTTIHVVDAIDWTPVATMPAATPDRQLLTQAGWPAIWSIAPDRGKTAAGHGPQVIDKRPPHDSARVMPGAGEAISGAVVTKSGSQIVFMSSGCERAVLIVDARTHAQTGRLVPGTPGQSRTNDKGMVKPAALGADTPCATRR